MFVFLFRGIMWAYVKMYHMQLKLINVCFSHLFVWIYLVSSPTFSWDKTIYTVYVCVYILCDCMLLFDILIAHSYQFWLIIFFTLEVVTSLGLKAIICKYINGFLSSHSLSKVAFWVL